MFLQQAEGGTRSECCGYTSTRRNADWEFGVKKIHISTLLSHFTPVALLSQIIYYLDKDNA